MLKRRLILLILCIICLLSSVSFVSLLMYLDPYTHKMLALSLLSSSFVLALSSFLSLIFYFFKKIYYRGDVGVYHIITSLRQAVFVSLFSLGSIVIVALNIPYILPLVLLLCVFLLLELFIKNL